MFRLISILIIFLVTPITLAQDPVYNFDSPIRQAVYSPDGQLLAVATEKSLELIDLQRGIKTPVLDLAVAHTDPDIQWSADGQSVSVTGERDEDVITVFRRDGRKLSYGSSKSNYSPHYSLSPDGNSLLVVPPSIGSSQDIVVEYVNLETKQHRNILEYFLYKSFPGPIAWHPDGKHFAMTLNGNVEIWDAYTSTDSALLRFSAAVDWLENIRWNADGTQLITISRTAVRIFDMSDGGKPIVTFPSNYLATFTDAFWINDQIMTIYDDHAETLDIVTGQLVSTLTPSRTAQQFAWSPDGSHVALIDGQRLEILETVSNPAPALREYTITTEKISLEAEDLLPNGVVRWKSDGNIMLDAPKIYFELNDPERRTYTLNTGDANVFPSVTSDDGLYKAFAIEDDDTRSYHLFLWDIQAGSVTELLPRHTGAVDDLLFSHDGTKIVSASEDLSIAVWNLRTGERLHTLWGSAGGSNDFAFNSDDSLLASVNDSRIYLWDAASGTKLYSRYAYYEHMSESFWSDDVQFSPDGSRVMFHDFVMDDLSFNGNSTVIFDTRTGDQLYSTTSIREIMHTSPDGNYFLWVENTGFQSITVRHLPTQHEVVLDQLACSNLYSFTDESVWRIEISPDSRLAAVSPLMTCSWEDTTVTTLENMVMLFDLTTGQRLDTLLGHNTPVYNIAFSPDGERLLSQSKDGVIYVWDVDNGELLEAFP